MLIAQISDSHFRSRDTRLFGALNTCRALERAIEAVMSLDPRPDAVIHTGDLVNDGEDSDHRDLSEILGRLSMPIFAVPGNHDRRERLREALSWTGSIAAKGPLSVTADLGPIRLVGLDSLIEGQAGGRLGEEQLGWLEEVLSAGAETPTLVFVHHPPFAIGIDFMDRIMLEDRAAFEAVIRRHPQVELVTCGHAHRIVHTRFAGTIAMIAPGVAHQVAFDLRPGAPSRWVPEPPGFVLHRWSPESGFASHVVYIADYGADAPLTDYVARIGQ
jgi:3',5'-cyclic-AMP phosphodiesterase